MINFPTSDFIVSSIQIKDGLAKIEYGGRSKGRGYTKLYKADSAVLHTFQAAVDELAQLINRYILLDMADSLDLEQIDINTDRSRQETDTSFYGASIKINGEMFKETVHFSMKLKDFIINEHLGGYSELCDALNTLFIEAYNYAIKGIDSQARLFDEQNEGSQPAGVLREARAPLPRTTTLSSN